MRHAREPGCRQPAKDLVITDSYDGHFVRHREPATTARFDNPQGPDITGGDHAHRFRQGCEPPCDLVPVLLVVAPRFSNRLLRRFVDVKAATECCSMPQNRIVKAPRREGGPRNEDQVAHSAFSEVRDTELHRRLVVRVDPWKRC